MSAMGTTGTITGVSRKLKEVNGAIQIIGVQLCDGFKYPVFENGLSRIFLQSEKG